MITQDDLFTATPPQLRRAEQALTDARNRRARQDYPMVRRGDSETSVAAALAAVPRAAGGRMLALTLLAQHGALTDFELATLSRLQQTSIGVRRGQLRDLGYVTEARDSLGRICKRPSPTRTPSTVWTITDEGRRFLRGALGAT